MTHDLLAVVSLPPGSASTYILNIFAMATTKIEQ